MAVAGAGGFGQFCLEAYRQTGDISVAAVADPNLAGSAPRTHPELSITADWRDLLDDPAIEVIHLATPPLLRAEIAVPALKAGKSVFCEKPLALSLREADEILDAARLAGRSVGVDYVLRHHPAFELVARLSASALFGPLRTFSLQNFAQALPGDHWMWDTEKSGGILVEHGVHFFDAYGQIAGAPEEVWGSAPRKEAVEVTVRYASGAIGRYFHEFAWPRSVERTHGIMFFEHGYVEIDGWIPERVHGRVDAPAAELEAVRPLCPHSRCARIPVPPLSTFGFRIAKPPTSPPSSTGCATSLRNTVCRAIAWSSPRATPATVCLWHSWLGALSKQEGASDYPDDRVQDRSKQQIH